jgi:hypothetical protein
MKTHPLQQNKATKQQIMFLRLSSGEDIIAKVEHNKTSKRYKIIDPLKIVYATSKNPGYISIAFMQWVFYKLCDAQNFDLKETDVLLAGNPSKDVMRYYSQTLSHFEDNEQSAGVNFISNSEDVDDMGHISPEETLEMLESYLEKMKKTKDKRNLN